MILNYINLLKSKVKIRMFDRNMSKCKYLENGVSTYISRQTFFCKFFMSYVFEYPNHKCHIFFSSPDTALFCHRLFLNLFKKISSGNSSDTTCF